jgi:hypothetical protein
MYRNVNPYWPLVNDLKLQFRFFLFKRRHKKTQADFFRVTYLSSHLSKNFLLFQASPNFLK